MVPIIGSFAAPELSRPKQHVERTITVGGNLRAVDARTCRVWLPYSISEQSCAAKKSRWQDSSEMDLPPVDAAIKQILDKEIDRFVDSFFPGAKSSTVLVKSTREVNSRLGVQALLDNDPQQALMHLNVALTQDPDDHETLHAAAVASEKLGDLQTARDNYSRAVEIAREGGKKDGSSEVRGYREDLSRVEHRLSMSRVSLAANTAR